MPAERTAAVSRCVLFRSPSVLLPVCTSLLKGTALSWEPNSLSKELNTAGWRLPGRCVHELHHHVLSTLGKDGCGRAVGWTT